MILSREEGRAAKDDVREVREMGLITTREAVAAQWDITKRTVPKAGERA